MLRGNPTVLDVDDDPAPPIEALGLDPEEVGPALLDEAAVPAVPPLAPDGRCRSRT